VSRRYSSSTFGESSGSHLLTLDDNFQNFCPPISAKAVPSQIQIRQSFTLRMTPFNLLLERSPKKLFQKSNLLIAVPLEATSASQMARASRSPSPKPLRRSSDTIREIFSSLTMSPIALWQVGGFQRAL
jgi:hypothetical protein